MDEVPDVPGAQIVQGMFADVLPGFLSEHPGAVAFVHVDSDLYSSAMTVLVHVGPRLVEGSVVLFDEYYNYPDWHRHEHRALLEYAERDPSRKDLRACASKLVSENVHVAKELVKGHPGGRGQCQRPRLPPDRTSSHGPPTSDAGRAHYVLNRTRSLGQFG